MPSLLIQLTDIAGVIRKIKEIRETFPDATLIAGNVARLKELGLI